MCFLQVQPERQRTDWINTTQTGQQYLPQKEFQKTGLSVQAPSSSNKDTVATVVHQSLVHHAKGELQRRRAQRAPKGLSGRTFFSKFTSTQQSYAAALRQDKQQQQPQTAQTEQQYVPQQEFQKTDLSVQAPSSSNNDSVATVVHQIMTKLTKAVRRRQ
jgi:hypothetical protein